MEAIETLKARIHATVELQALVKTMKVLAGLNIRQYEEAAHAVSAYNRTIDMGLQVALNHLPEPIVPPRQVRERKLAAIVLGSDQGMCGPLNDVIVGHAVRTLARLARRWSDQVILAVGLRAAAQFEGLGRTIETTLEVPRSIAGITATVHELLRHVEKWHVERGIEMIGLFYSKLMTGVFYRPRGMRLLPVDEEWIRGLRAKPWPSRVIPTYMIGAGSLYRSLIREYLFGAVFAACAESLASENAARLASMQVAERNIEERLKALTMEFHQVRQATVTSELLDIVSASEALAAKKGHTA